MALEMVSTWALNHGAAGCTNHLADDKQPTFLIYKKEKDSVVSTPGIDLYYISFCPTE